MNIRAVNRSDPHVRSCFNEFKDEIKEMGLVSEIPGDLKEILWQAAARKSDAGYGGQSNDGGAREFLYQNITKYLLARLGGRL